MQFIDITMIVLTLPITIVALIQLREYFLKK